MVTRTTLMSTIDDFEQYDQKQQKSKAPVSQSSTIDSFESQDNRNKGYRGPPEEKKISTLNALTQGALMPFGYKPSPEVYNQHKHAADIGGILSLGANLAPMSAPLKATTLLGRTALGALGGAITNGLPKFLSGVVQGKTKKQSLIDSTSSTLAGAGLGALAPATLSGLAAIGTKFKGLATPLIEHLANKEFDKFQAETNVTVAKAHALWKDISGGLSKDSLQRVVQHIEKPDTVVNLTEAEQQAVNKYTQALKPIQDMLKKYGLSNIERQNFIHHIYQGQTNDFYDYLKSIPGSKERKFPTYEEAVKFNKEKTEEVISKGLDPEKVKKFTPQQLRDNGLDTRTPRWLNLKPIYDPGLSLAATVKSASQTLNVRNYLHNMADLKDEEGNFLFETAREDLGKNYTTIKDERGLLKKYLMASPKDEVPGRAPQLTAEGNNIVVLKKYAKTVEDMINGNSSGAIQQGLSEANRILKHLTFFNPTFHVVNLATEGLRYMPGNIYRAFGFGAGKILKDKEMVDRMIKSNLNLNLVGTMKKEMNDA